MHFATRLGLNQPCRAPVTADDRPALLRKIATLEARVAELELALSASATVPSGAMPSATPNNKNTSTDINAKLKDEHSDGPWTELGISRRTYFRRKAAGLV